jgi:hypothetical protein
MMTNLVNFSYDRKQELYKSCIELKKAIEAKVAEKTFVYFLKLHSNFFKLPFHILQRQAYILLEGLFEYNKNGFSKRLHLKTLPMSFIESLAFPLYLLVNSKVKFGKKIDAQIVIDLMEAQKEIERFYPILNHFPIEKIAVIEKTNAPFSHPYKSVKAFNYKGYSFSLCVKYLLLQWLFLTPCSLFLSFFTRMNLVSISLSFYNNVLYHRSLYKRLHSNFFFQEKHHQSNAIKRHLINSEAKGRLSTIQKNIYQLGRNGFYYDFDIFFSLGRKSYLESLKFGANFSKVVPAGSLVMNSSYLHRAESREQKSSFDILFIGINAFQGIQYLDAYDSFIENYYECFRWIKRLNEESPFIKIGIKHHPSFKGPDPTEEKILQNSNISHLDKSLNSYQLSFDSRCVVSFGSTMIFELLGLNHPALMLDPKGESAFKPHGEDITRECRVENFYEFKAKVMEILDGKYQPISNKEDLCLNSQHSARVIVDEFSKGN